MRACDPLVLFAGFAVDDHESRTRLGVDAGHGLMFSAGGETRITSRVTGIFSIHDQHLILVVFEFALIDFGGAFNVTKAATMAETVWMERGMGSCSV